MNNLQHARNISLFQNQDIKFSEMNILANQKPTSSNLPQPFDLHQLGQQNHHYIKWPQHNKHNCLGGTKRVGLQVSCYISFLHITWPQYIFRGPLSNFLDWWVPRFTSFDVNVGKQICNSWPLFWDFSQLESAAQSEPLAML